MANNNDLSTGEKVVKFAKERGAKVEKAHGGFTAISTPRGKMMIYPGRDKLDKQTVSNTKRWLRLLGLLLFLLFCAYPIYIVLIEKIS